MADELPNVSPAAPQGEVTGDLNQIPLRRAQDFVSVYANSINFLTTPWDFAILFGQTAPEDPQDVHVQIRATVTLSPQMAKALVATLGENVRRYEQQFGEIRYTPIQPQTEEPSA